MCCRPKLPSMRRAILCRISAMGKRHATRRDRSPVTPESWRSAGGKSEAAVARPSQHGRCWARPTVFYIWHTVGVAWDVEFTDEFQDWWNALSEGQQDDVAHSVRHLIEFGPALGFPHSSKVNSSRYPQMRELRTQSAGGRCEPCTLLTHAARRSC
jgi:hypothetical protein